MSETNTLIEFAKSLVEVQSQLEHVKRDTQGYGYKYAQLDQVWDTIKEPLAKNGFALVQFPYNDGDLIGINSVLLHTSGHSLGTKIAMRPVKPDPQSVGSLITYLRRYSLMSIIGICPEDDDAQGAMPTRGGKSNFEFAVDAISQCTNNKMIEQIAKKISISSFTPDETKRLKGFLELKELELEE